MLHQLKISELDDAVNVQATAFLHDPLWCYIFPDENKRRQFIRQFFRVFISAAISVDLAYGVGEPLDGLAIWSKPEDSERKFFTQLVRFGGIKLLFNRQVFVFFKAFPIFREFERMQNQYAQKPYFYLNTISVKPESQGQGVASLLIRPFLNEADNLGYPVYTETITPENVSLYQYYGFEVQEEYQVPETDLKLWSFYRTPMI